jgi:hypothetical protein
MRLVGAPLVLDRVTSNDAVFASFKALLNRLVGRGVLNKHGARYALLTFMEGKQ